jgi:colanic acid biosynthesis glycosyl transferase WcaI
MSEKRILLIGGNYWPEPIGIGKYNGEMIEWLASKGHDCTVITSYPYYPHWKVQEPYSKQSFWFKKETIKPKDEGGKAISIYRCPQYTPQQPDGKKRMLLDLTFSISCLFIVFKLLFGKKYTHVVSVVPSFQVGLLAILYRKFTKAKFFYHIQDLQIDAALELGMIKSQLMINTMFKVERYILRKADVISSISAGMIKRIEKKCDKKVLFFPNWVDTNVLFPIAAPHLLKEGFGFQQHQKIILYSGAIGKKQGLESILYAASALGHLTTVKFIICGSGPYKKELEEMAVNLQLENLVFMPLQPPDKFNSFLNMADLHLVIQKLNASDLVMPSKLSAILSIGGAVLVTAAHQSTLHNVISEHQMGLLVEPENQQALIDTITAVVETDNGRIKKNALKYANRFLLKEKILSAYFKNFNNDNYSTPALKQQSVAGQ